MKEEEPNHKMEAVKYILSSYEKIDELAYHTHGLEIAVSLLGQEVVDEYLKKVYEQKETGDLT